MILPDKVNISFDEKTRFSTVAGPLGTVQKKMPEGALIQTEGNKLNVVANDKAIKGTVEALVFNMITGVTTGYKRNLKLLHAHFPISVEVKGKDIIIKNFLGEKQPRKTTLIGNTKIEVKGAAVSVSGSDKEAVGQTIANIRTVLRIRDKDSRVFQDGIYEVQGES